jgi:tetratricopeptide (TPR) repeat protein
MRLLTLLLIVGLTACGQQHKYVPDKKAMQLNDSAMRLAMHTTQDSEYQKVILLLDKATTIDTNYFIAYFNKLSYQCKIKQYDKALETAKHINLIRPNFVDQYVTVGILYEKTGDSITAKKYYDIALNKFNNILDTMNLNNKNYSMFLMGKGIDLILTGQQIIGSEILKKLYDKPSDEFIKDFVSPYINKPRSEVFNNLINPKESEQISYPN